MMKDLREKARQKKEQMSEAMNGVEKVGTDKFPLHRDNPYFEEHTALSELLKDAHEWCAALEATGETLIRNHSGNPISLNTLETGKAILKAPEEAQVNFCRALTERCLHTGSWKTVGTWAVKAVLQLSSSKNAFRAHTAFNVLQNLLERLIKRSLPFDIETAEALLEYNAKVERPHLGRQLRSSDLMNVVEQVSKGEEYSQRLELIALRIIHSEEDDKKRAKLADRFRKVSGKEIYKPGLKLGKQQIWGKMVLDFLEQSDGRTRAAWEDLLHHCGNLTAARASKRWMKEAASLLDVIGRPAAKRVLLEWYERSYPADQEIPPDPVADYLKGLVWCGATWKDRAMTTALSDLARASYKKVSGIGPRSTRVGNACVGALGLIANDAAIAELLRIKQRVSYVKVGEMTEKALERVSQERGMTPSELAEVAVPKMGLQADGIVTESFGEITGEIRVLKTGAVELAWIKEDGKRQKSVPKTISESHKKKVKNFKTKAKEIKTVAGTQATRLDDSLMREQEWEFTRWKKYYLEHPLMRTVSQRLIWNFQVGEEWHAAVPVGEHLIGVDGEQMGIEDPKHVSLWHPITANVDEIQAWRERLETLEITQPFKQAHREVYLLTDAERRTNNYSNRFAAHIIRQHQFKELCSQRGWKYTLQGAWDSFNTPELRLEEEDLVVCFDVEPAEQDGFGATHVYLYLITDQVRFMRGEEAIALDQIDERLFSEVMRQVDLFVSVASVGNNPEWADRGEAGGHWNYWREYAFGDLSASAKTRREVLERVVPRLKIADRCELDKQFLIVRGDRHAYKIHLGSGNIMMEPGGRYLCIVPGSLPKKVRGSEKLQLPFEGDRMLSIILSKAFMLAEDKKIKDRSILSQIG